MRDELAAVVRDLVDARLGHEAASIVAYVAGEALAIYAARIPSFDGPIDRLELAAMIDAVLAARRLGRSDLTAAARTACTRPGILRRVVLSLALVAGLEASSLPLARAS